MTAAQSRREIKKAKARLLIEEIALRAFLSRGFNNVTLDEIAEAAEVHKRTLLRYFPTKTDLVLCRYYDSLREFKLRIESREAGVSAVGVWKNHVVDKARQITTPEQIRLREMIYTDEALQSALLSIQAEYQATLTRELLDEGSSGSGNIVRAHVIAAALVGANFSIARSTILAKDTGIVEKRVLEVVDFIVASFNTS